jgi:hypothetical protein
MSFPHLMAHVQRGAGALVRAGPRRQVVLGRSLRPSGSVCGSGKQTVKAASMGPCSVRRAALLHRSIVRPALTTAMIMSGVPATFATWRHPALRCRPARSAVPNLSCHGYSPVAPCIPELANCTKNRFFIRPCGCEKVPIPCQRSPFFRNAASAGKLGDQRGSS